MRSFLTTWLRDISSPALVNTVPLGEMVVAVEHPEGMEQVLPNAIKVCSVTALSLGTLQNPYLTVSVILCTKTTCRNCSVSSKVSQMLNS